MWKIHLSSYITENINAVYKIIQVGLQNCKELSFEVGDFVYYTAVHAFNLNL
jgi:hypothetical protein